MDSKRKLMVALLFFTTGLFAQVGIETIQKIVISGDLLRVKEAQISEKLTAKDVDSDSLKTKSVTCAGPAQSDTLQTGAITGTTLTVKSIGAADKPVEALTAGSVTAANITASGNIVGKSISVETVNLMQGGKQIGSLGPDGLTLQMASLGGNGLKVQMPTGSIEITAGPQLVIRNADGKTSAVIVLDKGSSSVALTSGKGSSIWSAPPDKPPTIALGDYVYPPPPEMSIAATEGSEDQQVGVRYWVRAEILIKSNQDWKIRWTAEFQDLTPKFARHRVITAMIVFLDDKGKTLFYDDAKGISLPEKDEVNQTVRVTGAVEPPNDLASKARKVDAVLALTK